MFKKIILLPLGFLLWNFVIAQDKVVSRKLFFTNDTILDVTLKTDMKRLAAQKKEPSYQKAVLVMPQGEGKPEISADVSVRLRGNFRRENCKIASLMVDFSKEDSTSKLKNLKTMKWVAPCERGFYFEQFVVKEFLTYKMYQLFTEKSFNVRMLRITFQDINGKAKDYTQYGFAIEDVDDMAKRNGMVEEDDRKYQTEQTDRYYGTLVGMFQYMIGNTDYGVPVYHNIKLLLPKDSPMAKPYIVPYDFDYSGLVNANYATPNEELGITSVTERLYRGFPRELSELKSMAQLFIAKKEQIYALVNENLLLAVNQKKEMTSFLDSFYGDIVKDSDLERIFIKGARKQ
jgi:hypothetical protein